MAEKISTTRNGFGSIQVNPTSENDKLRSMSSTTSEFLFEGQDTVDAVPQRMQLICDGEDYFKHRQASVENLIPSARLYGSMPRPKRTYEGKYYLSRNSSHSKPASGINHEAEVEVVRYDEDNSNSHVTNSRHLNNNSKSTACNENGANNSDEQTQELNIVERDSAPSRQSKPSKDFKNTRSSGDSGNGVVSPPQVSSFETREEAQNQCCCSLGCSTVSAMFKWKYMFSKFSAWDCCLSLFSFSVYIFDVVTDLLLVLWYYYYRDEDPAYLLFFRLTLAFVVGPSLIVQIFSLKWVIDDFRNKRATSEKDAKDKGEDPPGITACQLFVLIFSIILHLFQLATLFRYVRVLIYGFKSRYYEVKRNENAQTHYDKLWKYENFDVNMLRVIESFLESAPQLVLQLYIMLTKTVEIINVVSCVGSLIGVSTAMVTIQRAIRNSNPDKDQLTLPASIVMFIWRACTVSSRVLAFSLFLTIQPLVLLVGIICHWFVSAMCIACKGTKFCGGRKAAEIFFDVTVGFVYTFCFFNVHEEKPGKRSHARYRMLVFYIIIFIENLTLSVIWFFFRENPVVFFTSDDPTDFTLRRNESTSSMTLPLESDRIFPWLEAISLVIMVHVLFFLGMVFMLLYYSCCHPKKNPSTCNCCCPKQDSDSTEANDTSSASQSGSEDVGMTQNSYSMAEPIRSQTAAEENGVNQVLRHPQEYPENRDVGAGRNRPRTPSPRRNWDIFNRGKRAKKLYTRQYSKEKYRDKNDKTSQRVKISGQNAGAETISVKFNSNQEVIVQNKGDQSGPSHESPLTMKHSTAKPITKASQGCSPPESSTYCDKKSSSLYNENASCSDDRSHINNNSNLSGSSSASLPKKSRRRGYSASMSCLVEGKYGLSSDKRFRKQAFKGPSYTLNDDEVLECMETTL